MRTPTLSLTLALVLHGCAYQRAMRHGETAAAAQDWVRAYDAYRYANHLQPGEAEIAAQGARAELVEAELAEARAGIAARDLTRVATHLRAAERLAEPGDERVAATRAESLAAILADIDGRLGAGIDLGEVYAFVAGAQSLHPDSAELEDKAEVLRARLESESRSLVAEGRYPEARARAVLLAQNEPEHRTRGHALEAEVTTAWVTDLVARAERAGAGRPGLAAVYWARAHEVGGAEAHRLAVDTSLAAAASVAKLKVFVDTKGGGARHWRLRKTLREGVGNLNGAVPGYQSSWDVMATVTTDVETCDETRKAVPLEKEYISGTRQVPNPAFAEVTTALEEATTSLAEREEQLEQARAVLADTRARTQELESAYAEAQHSLAAATATRDATDQQIAASLANINETTRQLQAIPVEDQNARTPLAEELTRLKGIHSDWTTKKGGDDAQVAAAQAKLSEVEADLGPARERLTKLTDAASAVDEVVTSSKQKVAELTTKRFETPETLTEDVKDIARYDETTWTLTCAAPTTLHASTSWTSARERKHRFEATRETTDLERPGHEGAAIEADAKAYPKTRAELAAELDAASIEAVTGEIDALLGESYTKTLAGALAASDAEAGADALITVLASAPQRVDPETRTRARDYLASHFGLEHPEVVGVVQPEQGPGQVAQSGEGS